tara:strand:+ start:1688 stop:2059 length:372 start_codon:yes stop_codon:yes gene_type:complete
MKNLFLALLGVLSLTSFNDNVKGETVCDVKAIYKAVAVESGSSVLTVYGDVEKATLLLKPATMDEGALNIVVTRKGSNIYKVEGTDYYIETRSCYKYATNTKALLKVETNTGYNKGVITFDPQ